MIIQETFLAYSCRSARCWVFAYAFEIREIQVKMVLGIYQADIDDNVQKPFVKRIL